MSDKQRLKNELLLAPLTVILYIGIYLLFFGIFSIRHFQMKTFSRTSGVTLITFSVLLLLMVSVYGGYDIGKRKSKPVISSLVLAVFITDLVTYVIFQIMNVNENKYLRFTFFGTDFIYLLFILTLQSIFIFVMVRLGNRFYFCLYPPEKCCIIVATQGVANHMMDKIGTRKLQYKVEKVYHFGCKDLRKKLAEYETIFFGDVPHTERAKLLEYCYKKQKNVYFSAHLDDIMISQGSQVVLDDMSFVFMPRWEMNFFQRAFKRGMDLVLSILALIVLSPLLLVIAFFIACEDGAPVLFTQDRMTKNGRIFKIQKFRTMNKEVSFQKKKAESVLEGDERITRTGAFLRKYRLDELPQLWNILKGDMSFVGPRPEMLENVTKYTEELPAFSYRYKVKAGLTGYAQIEGKYNTTPQDKLMLDMMYIQNYSIFVDLKILLRTLMIFFRKDSTAGFKKNNVEKTKYPVIIKE